MNEDLILFLGTDALKTTAWLASPLLIAALVTGLLVSVFQAITQINEATLTFIPKMIIVAFVIMFAGSWMIDVMKSYTVNLYGTCTLMINSLITSSTNLCMISATCPSVPWSALSNNMRNGSPRRNGNASRELMRKVHRCV